MSNRIQDELLDVFLETQNEEVSFDKLRTQCIQEGIDNIKDRIRDIEIKPSGYTNSLSQSTKDTPVDKSSKLKSIGDKAYNTYRKEIKPKEEKKVEEKPSTIAGRADVEARMRELVKTRNGGDYGRSSVSGPNGSGNVNDGSSSLNVGLYPTSLTIEEYENYINSLFEKTITIKEDVTHEINSNLPTIVEEIDSPLSEAVEELEEKLLELEDGSWQAIDTLMRSICKEHNITPKELHKEFKKTHGMIPDDWLKEQKQVTETCGWFPLDEVVRINKVGMVYEVTFMFRGMTQRLKFFWPEVNRPTKAKMQQAVEKLYPTAKLLVFYPSMDQKANSMVILSPLGEYYDPFQEDDWGLMSEEATLIYEEICTEEGEPLTPPYMVDENTYEIVVEDFDTGEEKIIRFEEVRKDDNGNSSCWDGYVKKGLKKKGGKMVNNCVKEEGPSLSVGRGEKLSVEAGGGLTAKGRAKYNRATGSNLKPPVTSDNPSPADAERRKRFCSRSRSWNGERGKAARRRWKC
ncbi:hypothetical cyanophage protein [Synechococcus phage S-CRM01]|uniref:hypothetical cyanophage protein n=1 Tax=Synechococcus phage S-CRM01 TaxID=1026955 RepID=UPI000209E34C|nr:hypothetical cyanophage protein [Synechococcus phage S-CRM01]AEC52981.1 hypothetical cyanophage protein [Synechococcus phage S-CRM01]